MDDPTVITEIDIADPERDASTWIRCDECNDLFMPPIGYAWEDICPLCAMAD